MNGILLLFRLSGRQAALSMCIVIEYKKKTYYTSFTKIYTAGV